MSAGGCSHVAARWAVRLLAVLVLFGGATAGAAATPGVDDFASVFASATRFGPMAGDPPAVPAYRGDALIGYVLSTQAVVASVGFSGKPLDVLVGIDLKGKIVGARILSHQEPILMLGVPPTALGDFVAQYKGRDIRQPVRIAPRRLFGRGGVDAVAGATISSVILSDSILTSARAVARSRGILGNGEARLDLERFRPADWPALVGEGAIQRLHVSLGEAMAAFAKQGARLYPPGMGPIDPEADFIDLYIALATPPSVGRNLLGDRLYGRVTAALGEGDQVLFLAGRGLYSFKGTAYRKTGVFDRIQLVQGANTLRFGPTDHRRLDKLAVAGAPELRERALFVIRAGTGFDPLQPWRLELLVAGDPSAEMPAFVKLDATYHLPSSLVVMPPAAAAAPPPLWVRVWRERSIEVGVLVVALLGLSVILVFQDTISRHRRLFRWLRIGFLSFTVAGLGWNAGAQLSVLNVLTFTEALRTTLRWEIFLLEPLIFILWSYVAVAMLFWARGVFCGWLCPFGALQELLAGLARRLGVPQITVPFRLHERLWPIKYVIFIALFGLALNAMTLAQTGSEVEPFKTAIVLKFDREWRFVLYPLALLVVGLFVERAFCRYLCPLGAALAIPARLRMFDWLRRRPECGSSCHVCAQRCPVQAIHPDGHINLNECIYCLECQVLYFDDHTCPPLIRRRRRAALASPREVIARMARRDNDAASGRPGERM